MLLVLVEELRHFGLQVGQPFRREGAVVEQGRVAGLQLAQLRQEMILQGGRRLGRRAQAQTDGWNRGGILLGPAQAGGEQQQESSSKRGQAPVHQRPPVVQNNFGNFEGTSGN